jgi:LuxR family transcriptional regulator, maltose regulon positive regulatory protein
VAAQEWPEIIAGGRCLARPDIAVPAPGAAPSAAHWFALAAERLDAGDAVATRRLLRSAATAGSGAAAFPRTAFELAAARLDTDLDRAGALADRVLANPERPEARPLARLVQGAVHLHHGRMEAAGRSLADAVELSRRHDLGRTEIGARSHLAAWHAARGRLHRAARHAGEVLAHAGRLGLTQMADLGWSRLALAEVHFQWDRLEEAERYAGAAVDTASGDRLIPLWGTLLLARIRTAGGQVADADRLVRAVAAEVSTADLPLPLRRATELVAGELRLACGDLSGAREKVDSARHPEPLPAPAAVLEASVLLAEGRPALAAAAVLPYVQRVVDAPRTYQASAALIGALADHARGRRDHAARSLDVALRLAEEEDLRRCFTAGGHRVQDLLESVAPTLPAYRPMVAALTAVTVTPPPGRPTPGTVAAAPAPVVTPLTGRELTILRYLQGSLSHGEIAALLFISVNTVKTHVKNIYAKLGSTSRRDAVRRGREFRLL